MKTALLEVRPLVVRKTSRTRGHVAVAMLALKVVRELDRGLKAAFGTTDEGDSAITVQEALHALSRLAFSGTTLVIKPFLAFPYRIKNRNAFSTSLGSSLHASRSASRLQCR